ncbi:CLIP domain-containing serine protease HP8-like isoform X2 [Frankliniella occidentalis]|uniref:CLIP domain-containing serine protease HP8-like isoform X2 n=1 Tax=Frankliniella occidentalis TaxID=133901 RepID=A0A9C6X8P8_FRAOC|nr:CLIP domain-containing serine protease HP8-like isoform X2 [Frankliniella occidentalis]
MRGVLPLLLLTLAQALSTMAAVTSTRPAAVTQWVTPQPTAGTAGASSGTSSSAPPSPTPPAGTPGPAGTSSPAAGEVKHATAAAHPWGAGPTRSAEGELNDDEDPPVSLPAFEWTPGHASRGGPGSGDTPERADLGWEAHPVRNGRPQRVDRGEAEAPPSSTAAVFDNDAPGWRLMDLKKCGLSSGPAAVADRIVGGVAAALGQFPWLARIGYNLDGVPRRVYRCAGAVITHFHVLTAAHCVKNLPENFEFAGVRLGEWDTTTDPDCQNSVCAPPVYDMDPESVIVHQDYNNPRFANDIALVKLAQKINFNGWVAPVCVPYGDLLSRSYESERTEVAGWGIYDISLQKSSQELRRVHLPVVSNSICHALYRNQANITKRQLCAGGELGFDACSGDSGGPLLKVEAYNGGPRYFIVGIVSFGSKRCGLTPSPGVYTRVSYYVDWILDNIG